MHVVLSYLFIYCTPQKEYMDGWKKVTENICDVEFTSNTKDNCKQNLQREIT